jgi:hypothetical protein
MRRIRFRASREFVVIFAAFAILLLAACSVNVKKEQNGEEKQVDISTPIGGIHVGKGVDPEDVGIAIYPGARLEENDASGNDKSANVNISGFGYGIKVTALEYQSDDAPAKIVAYYQDQLKKYGSVLECHTANFNVDSDIKDHDQNSHELTCEGSQGSNTELKVGTKENQHIVAVKPQGKGSSFSLVYVRTHGKDAEI